jgi:hypothetical protein
MDNRIIIVMDFQVQKRIFERELLSILEKSV